MNEQNFETFSDADFFERFKYVELDGAPINLVGSTMRMMVRANAASATVFMELSTVNERILIDYFNTGIFTITIPLAELSNLSPGIYIHSLVMTRSDNFHELIWIGTLTHSVGPTR